MITDTEIKIKGIEALINTLGAVEAERFISLVMREPFDYTKWQRTLWVDKSVAELSAAAMQFRKMQNEREQPKAFHLTVIPLRFIVAGELGRYTPSHRN